jgi:putative endonuclease
LPFHVYILSNKAGTVLYTDVTNDLSRRVYEHTQKLVTGFTQKYNATRLVHCEPYDDPTRAIAREKQIDPYETLSQVQRLPEVALLRSQ